MDFKNLIDANYINSPQWNFINSGIFDIYEIIDDAYVDLVTVSGGYDRETYMLIGASRKDLPVKLVINKEIKERVFTKLQDLKSLQNTEPVWRGSETIKKIEAALYPVLEIWDEKSLQHYTVAKMYLNLIMIQNRLLIVQIEYLENSKNK